MSPHDAVESVARHSYGRLIAYIAARSGDLAAAEDALADAIAAALERWPCDGVPEKPEAWLLQAARNRIIDAARRRQVRENAAPEIRRVAKEAQTAAMSSEPFPDERLKLLFVCAHPAIDPAARTPLMLQTVLGIDAARIASAFLVSPAAMSQRLVRAKTKIRVAGIPFRVPERREWDERVSFVLDAIYAAYTAGWELINETAAEAIDLGRTLVGLMPAEPEARGLLSLMLHCEARREARYRHGKFVPLPEQDTALWSRALMEEAEQHLRTAAALKTLGRYQLEAAIQSIHAQRAIAGEIDWAEIALLYEGLVRYAPAIGSQVGRAVALAESGRLDAAEEALEAIPRERVAAYQPYWAARAHLLRMRNRSAEAREAYERAASLTCDPALREYLLHCSAALAH